MAVLVDITKCIGCESCSVACKLWNKLPYNRPKSRKQKEEKDLDDDTWTTIQRKRVDAPNGKGYTRFVKKQCMHCLEPSCASACFSKALRVDPETHAVVYIPELCVGCRYCMLACPFEIPRYQWDEALPLITKCQLCVGRLKAGDAPACVSACPTGALTFGDRDELLKKAHAIIDRDPRYGNHVYGEKELGGTQWLYIADQPFDQLGFKTDFEEVAPTVYTHAYLSKVPFLAAAWGLFLAAISVRYYKKHKNDPPKPPMAEKETKEAGDHGEGDGMI